MTLPKVRDPRIVTIGAVGPGGIRTDSDHDLGPMAEFSRPVSPVIQYLQILNDPATGKVELQPSRQLEHGTPFNGSGNGLDSSATVFPLAYRAVFTITGGTHRYDGATGYGELTGTDLGGGAFNFTYIGRVIPDSSTRP